ncbi:predicted protein [Naegleria gruberi]|uniref:Predicted protein n=1 Tax=Naegleria gruberi TaxID=5762 RepID=D2VM62_NAEGR|nr:uncharacterized protein NAEGRDRAFT_70023 [Naegleria gruberi]EFC42266.1 predicted protein [Naegleria gruberi]|eukprot:XP_002675010.1 predicted protein [Naegleria gruberi strain NEG-M]
MRSSTSSSINSSCMSNNSSNISNISNTTSNFGCKSHMNQIPNSPRITMISYQVHKPVKRIDFQSSSLKPSLGVKRYKRRISFSIPFGTDLNVSSNSNNNNIHNNNKKYQHPNFNSSNIQSILNYTTALNNASNKDSR